MNTPRVRVGTAVAGIAALSLLFTACSASGGSPDSADAVEPAGGDGSDSDPVTLTVTTFGSMGLDDLYAEYETANPHVTIEATNIDTGGNALTDWQTKRSEERRVEKGSQS